MHLFIAILIMEVLVGAELDLFVPSFPDIQDAFNISTFMVEMLLGINLLAHCFTSIIVGNLGDRFGSKVVILIGLLIFMLGSICCLFAQDYYMLLFGRFLQGVGISGVAVLSYIILADIYSVEQQQTMMGALNGTVTLAMAFAPVVGSYIDMFFTWRGNFAALLILAVVCFILGILYVPNGKKTQTINISLKEYLVIFQSKKAIYYIITIMFTVQGYWIFIGMAPILYMKDMGVPIQEFGLYQGAMSAVFSIISFASGYLIRKFGTKSCFCFSIGSFLVFMILSVFLVVFKVHDPVLITITTLFVSVGTIFPITILWPLMLIAVPNAKGRITAIVNSGRLIVTALSLQTVSYFYKGNFTQLAIAINITIVITLVACYKLLKEDRVFQKQI